MFKIIIAGLGWWGKVMIHRLSSSKKVKIVNLIEPYPDKEALQLAKSFNLEISYDFDKAVKSIDFDGIILCTPNSFHKNQTILCADLKKHVFCEKPLSLIPSDVQQMIEVCKNNNVILPTFEGSAKIYDKAEKTLSKNWDTASVYEVLKMENVNE